MWKDRAFYITHIKKITWKENPKLDDIIFCYSDQISEERKPLLIEVWLYFMKNKEACKERNIENREKIDLIFNYEMLKLK
jgi:hypothetical protein